MRDLQVMTGIVGVCVLGVLVSLGGGIYTAVERHREQSQTHLDAFPIPATPSQPIQPGRTSGLPLPAH